MSGNRPSTSSSHAGPSRRRRRTETPSSDEDVRETQAQTQAAVQQSQGGGKGGLTLAEVQKCATKLVRLALFYEYQHKVLRRDIISQKAKGAFSIVLNRAQTMLRQKFGMELYELRGKSKGAGAGEATQAATQTQKRPRTRRLDAIEEDEEEGDEGEEGGTATQAAAKQPGSKTYIVRSILSPQIRELISSPQPLTMFDQRGERNEADTDYVDSGALIPWEKADGTLAGSVEMLGIRTIVLCLVLCMGRVITENTLYAYLKRLNLYPDTLLPYSSPDGKDAHMTLAKYLDLLARQQYLEKVKVAGQVVVNEGAVYEWKWGNREAEFSEKEASEFIIKVLTGNDDDDEDDDEGAEDGEDEEGDQANVNGRAGARNAQDRQAKRVEARQKKKQQMREDIARAAGGPLKGDS